MNISRLLFIVLFISLGFAPAYGADRGSMVRVVVWDDTQKVPLHAKAEIWFRGHGSWWLKPDIDGGSAAKKLGRREVGVRDTLHCYPDGRDGIEMVIPVVMTAEMNSEASDRDSIMITISDSEVEVVWLAVKAATGDATLKFKRKKKPNKAPEPTPTAVTPRAIEMKFERKRWSAEWNEARVVPAVGVAHL